MFYRVAFVAGTMMTGAVSVMAQADTDGFLPVLDYAALGANVTSIFAQAQPIGLAVAGMALGLGLIAWVISTLRSVFRSRRG